MHDLQLWQRLYAPWLSDSSRPWVIVLTVTALLLVLLALLILRQRPTRRVSRARHPETIPTWGDLYLDSLAENYRRPHRFSRSRTTP